jgi:metallo-beta-lactamase family protein
MGAVSAHFLGAAGTVTGSKTLIETPEINILIDCGMFQGEKSLRERNWEPLPTDVSKIDLVLLTHGHLDHTGYLPRLLKEGFKGEVWGTAPTLAITKIILLDSGKIHEESAEKANKEGFSKHRPALPFYTVKEAERTLSHLRSCDPDIWHEVSEGIRCRFIKVGHILGACFIELEIFGKLLVFSGDVGRPGDLLLEDPERPRWADFLFMESTYGDTEHLEEDVDQTLIDLIDHTLSQRGNLIIPSFAVERLQTLLYLLWQLYHKNRIPYIPVVVDSPMGQNVLDVFERFTHWHKLSASEYHAMENFATLITSYKKTWETIDDPRPKIVIAGSGMITGGRVLTYLGQLIDRSDTTVLLVGFMAEGTRGRQLSEGATQIRFFGRDFPVKARIVQLRSLSAHADKSELLDWSADIRNFPEGVFLIHGEPEASASLKQTLEQDRQWPVHIPYLGERRILWYLNDQN